jgi:hypothetical protein
MSETKDEIAAERDQLRQELDTARAENATLRQQIGNVGAQRPANPEPRFELSEGERAELELQGFTRSVRDSSTIVASDFPNLVDPDKLSDSAKANDKRERERRDGARTHEG